MVFGELVNGRGGLRIWISPRSCKKGYGNRRAAQMSSEMAGVSRVPMVVRAPAANPG